MTIQTALLQGTELLDRAGIAVPRLTAEVLLGHAIHRDRVYLQVELKGPGPRPEPHCLMAVAGTRRQDHGARARLDHEIGHPQPVPGDGGQLPDGGEVFGRMALDGGCGEHVGADFGQALGGVVDQRGLGVNAGVSPQGAEEPLAVFPFGGAVLTLWELAPGEDRDGTDLDRTTYVAVVVDGDLDPVHDRLAAAGVEVTDVAPGADNDRFYFFDPDGNRFEVSRPASEYQAH